MYWISISYVKLGGGKYEGRLPNDMIDEQRILEHYNKLNLDHKKILP